MLAFLLFRYCICFLFFVTLETDCLSAARSHFYCHAVLFKLILKLKGGLPNYLSGRREEVIVKLVYFDGLMSCLSLPHVLENMLGNVLEKFWEGSPRIFIMKTDKKLTPTVLHCIKLNSDIKEEQRRRTDASLLRRPIHAFKSIS